MTIHVAPMRFRELLKCKHESNGGIPYQEVVVHERPGLPRDDLRPLRTPLSEPLPARIATETETIGTMSTAGSSQIQRGMGNGNETPHQTL
jgi:hypothetical protein